MLSRRAAHVKKGVGRSSSRWTLAGSMLLALAFTPQAQAQTVTAIRAGRILPASGPAIENGIILIKSGKIIAVGRADKLTVPSGAHIIDARTEVIIPGLVAAYSTLAGSADSAESVAPDSRAIDGFDFLADQKPLLSAGVTSVYLSTSSHRLISGQGAVVKLAGVNAKTRTLRESADVRVSLGQLPKAPPAIFRPAIPPTTDNPLLPAQRPLVSVRPAEFALLRQIFADARAELLHPGLSGPRVGVGASDAGLHSAERRVKLAPVISVVKGAVPLRIAANTVGDIRAALRFADEEKIKIVLEGASEGGKIAAEIAAHHFCVVASTPTSAGRTIAADFERDSANGKQAVDNLAALTRAGIIVALRPGADVDLRDLLLQAGSQVAVGLSEESALRSITSHSASILGIGERVGAIAPGRDADLVVLSGAPFATATHVDLTLIDGEVVYYRRAAQSAITSTITAIRAHRVFTVSNGIVENGVVLVRAGKIIGVNRDGLVPPGATVVDASHSDIIPGIIDSYSYLGLHADSEPTTTALAAPASGPISARTRLFNALEADEPGFAEALKGGVTALLLAPPAGGAVSGTATLIKPIRASGSVDYHSDRLVKERAALCFNLQGGSPRMAQVWMFEELLQGAKAYNQRRIQYLRDEKQWEVDRDEAKRLKKDLPTEPAEVAKDEDQEPFAALFRGEIPAFVHASRADEILTALKVFRDENDLSLVLVGATDSYHVSDELHRRNASVAFGPEILKQDPGATVNLPGVMSLGGVPVLLESNSSSGTQFLRLSAINAVRNGMEPAAALRAITLSPAIALHVQDRLGSIEPDKDADLVILSGDPLEATSRVEMVYVNGKVVYDSHAKK